MPRACSRLCSGGQGECVACNGVGDIGLSWVRSAKCSHPSRSGRVRLAKRCVVHVQTLFLLWFCPLALFVQPVGFVCAKCQKWLRNRTNTGGSRRRGKPRSVGRVKRDTDCGTCPRSLANTTDGRANRPSPVNNRKFTGKFSRVD